MLSEGGRFTMSHSELNVSIKKEGIVVGMMDVDVVDCDDESVSFEATNNVGTLRLATIDEGTHALTTVAGTIKSAVVPVRRKILMMAIAIVMIDLCLA
jgi:hypothetical protein